VGIFGQKMNITQFEHGKVSLTSYSGIHELIVSSIYTNKKCGQLSGNFWAINDNYTIWTWEGFTHKLQ